MTPPPRHAATFPIRQFIALVVATVVLAAFLGQLLADGFQKWSPVVGGIVLLGLTVGVVGLYAQRRRRRMPNAIREFSRKGASEDNTT